MVCEWGMSEKMGMVEYGEHEDYVFLGRDISRARDYSEATAEQIDGEVRKLIDDAYKTAMDTLTAHRQTLEVIAKALLEYETLDGAQIKEIMEHGRLINPPPAHRHRPPARRWPDKPPKQVVVAPEVPPLSRRPQRRARLAVAAVCDRRRSRARDGFSLPVLTNTHGAGLRVRFALRKITRAPVSYVTIRSQFRG